MSQGCLEERAQLLLCHSLQVASLGALPGGPVYRAWGWQGVAGGILDCMSGTWALFFVVKLCVLGRWGKRAGPCPALISTQMFESRWINGVGGPGPHIRLLSRAFCLSLCLSILSREVLDCPMASQLSESVPRSTILVSGLPQMCCVTQGRSLPLRGLHFSLPQKELLFQAQPVS